jgi:hypothetical protein
VKAGLVSRMAGERVETIGAEHVRLSNRRDHPSGSNTMDGAANVSRQPRGRPFIRGQSGNPGGRPKRPKTIEARRVIADMKAAARELTQQAIDTLAAIMNDPKAPAAARVSAATAILDRGHGKPTQAVEMSGRDGGPIETADVSAREIILERLASIAPRIRPPAEPSECLMDAGDGSLRDD